MHPNWALPLRILLAIHIACGTVGFVCAPVALLTAKGGKTHRRWGSIYFWAMAGVGATALILSFTLPVYFLAMVSLFSFYAAFAAYRVLYLKQMYQGQRPAVWDWLAAIVTLLSSFLLFLMGFLQPRMMRVGLIFLAGRPVSIVSVVFGLLGMRLASASIRSFVEPSKQKMFWWFNHLQGMIASYIAAMTAFSAVNLGHWFGPAWWVWLWPTLIGVPAIFLWTAYYKKKFGPRPTTAAS